MGINIAVLFCCGIFSIMILIAVLLKRKKTEQRRAFAFMLGAYAVLMLEDLVNYFYEDTQLAQLQMATNILSYMLTAVATYSIYNYLLKYLEFKRDRDENHIVHIWAKIYTALCICFLLFGGMSNLFFVIDSEGMFRATKWAFLAAIVFAPTAIANVVLSIAGQRYSRFREGIIHTVFCVVYTVFGTLDSINTTTFNYILFVIFSMLIYIFIDLEQERESEQNEKDLIVSELNALRLQMNPHFIYNTLASIDALCVINPEEARVLIDKFTKHLRASYLNDPAITVPFEQELKNLECYLEVEKTRFPDLEVVYDIKVTDFMLPALTVQPILENAIKHGICGRDYGKGTVTIATCESDSAYVVRIIDDGVGFDASQPLEDDGRHHIGIANTKKRLELIGGGSLKITSIPNVGTSVDIIIPKEK
ncbi:MAG: histidine kinase [Eubacterium sp.]|nr:histidine kinase [Candidatus Colimonas fimequi]